MRSAVAVFAVGLLGACDGPTSVERKPDLQLLAGANVTDTVFTTPAQGLVAQVRDATGKPASGIEVRFESLDEYGIGVGRIGDPGFGMVTSAITDGSGRATVRVGFGSKAGEARILISVPLFSLADTARYTVEPGAAIRVRIEPKDTILVVGSSFKYRGSTADAYHNARQDPATFSITAGNAVAVTSDGVVTVTATGLATVRVTASIAGSVFHDLGQVAVLPAGTIVWSEATSDGPLTILDLTGSGPRTLTDVGLAASWEPGHNRLVAVRDGELFLLDTNGNTTPLATAPLTSATWPEWSADGEWIYFHADESFTVRVARIRPDGSDLQVITPQRSGWMPTPSPDGQSVAILLNGHQLAIVDLQTGNVRELAGATNAMAPRWSPDGEWIAFTAGFPGPLMLVRPDGTGLRGVGTASLNAGISWSPDSKWIAASAPEIALVEVATGGMLRLGRHGFYPAWKR